MKEMMKILVVDDDRSMVRTICDILRVKGYTAEPAYSGEEAVDKTRSNCPDCVLMDIKMPGINGVDALKLIKESAPELPVVMMSAYATEEQVEEAKKQGAYTVLCKPINIQVVLSFLSHLKKEKSILIVDDDPAFCITLRDIFLARGYSVATEMCPDMVLNHLERDYQLVVILDLKLGTASGLDVLKDIRARYPTKPVIMATAYGEEMAASIEKGLRIGAYTCMYKPFEAEELIDIVESIRRAKLRRVLTEQSLCLGG